MSWVFDARQFEPADGPQVWEPGLTPIVIVKTEEKPLKGDKPGMLWEYTIKGLDGPNKGKTGYIRLNHKNPSQEAMERAYKTQAAISYVTGVIAMQHPNQLCNIPFLCDVELRKSPMIDRDGNEVKDEHGKPVMREQNEFRTFRNIQNVSPKDIAAGVNGGQAPAAAPPQNFAPQPAPAAAPPAAAPAAAWSAGPPADPNAGQPPAAAWGGGAPAAAPAPAPAPAPAAPPAAWGAPQPAAAPAPAAWSPPAGAPPAGAPPAPWGQ
jgi:hypothetical protein